MSTLILLVAAAVIALAWLYMYSEKHKHCGNGRRMPGPKGLPYFGSAFTFNVKKMHMQLYGWAEKYGKMFAFSTFGQKVVFVNDLELIRKAFCTEEYGNIFHNRPETFVGKYVLDTGSDLALDENYGRQTVLFRKMINKCLKVAVDNNDDNESSDSTDSIDRLLELIDSYGGQNIDMNKVMENVFGYEMCQFLSGNEPQDKDINSIWELNDNISILLQAGMNYFMTSFPCARYLPGFPRTVYNRVMTARNHIFDRFTGTRSGNLGLYKSLVNFQLDENQKFGYEAITDGNVKSLLMDIITGGTESTKCFLIMALINLLNNEQCLAKVQAEVDNVIGAARRPRLADKLHMHYTMACLYETLRRASVGPLGLPHKVAECTEFEGHHICKDTVMYANIWFVHHDPSVWADPWKFIPERFLDADGNIQPPSAECRRNIIPFLIGKRSCPGAYFAINRAFLHVVHILQRFDLLPPSDSDLCSDDPRASNIGLFLSPPSFFCRAVRKNTESTV